MEPVPTSADRKEPANDEPSTISSPVLQNASKSAVEPLKQAEPARPADPVPESPSEESHESGALSSLAPYSTFTLPIVQDAIERGQPVREAQNLRVEEAQRLVDLPSYAPGADKRAAASKIMAAMTGGMIDSANGSEFNPNGVGYGDDEYYALAQNVWRKGMGELMTPDLVEWDDLQEKGLPERAAYARKQLGLFSRIKTDVVGRGVDAIQRAFRDNRYLADDDLVGAPADVVRANDVLKEAARRQDDLERGTDSGIPYSAERREADLSVFQPESQKIEKWLQDREDLRAVGEYENVLSGRHAWRTIMGIRPLLSPDGQKVLDSLTRDEKWEQEGLFWGHDSDNVWRFKNLLPPEEQRLIAGVANQIRDRRDRGIVRDSLQAMWKTVYSIGSGAAHKAVIDRAVQASVDAPTYQRIAETEATLSEAMAPRLHEYGVLGQAVIGTASALPFLAMFAAPQAATVATGSTAVGATMTGANLGLLALESAKDIESRIAAGGGKVTGPQFQAMTLVGGAAYAAVMNLQMKLLSEGLVKPMTDIERRMAYATFWSSAAHPFRTILTAEGREGFAATAPLVAKEFASGVLTADLQMGLMEGVKAGFVSYGLEGDVARDAAESSVQALKDSLGTMVGLNLIHSVGAGYRGNQLRNYTQAELRSANLMRLQLDRAAKSGNEKEVRRIQRTLGGLMRTSRNAGNVRNATREFMRLGLDEKSAVDLSVFLARQTASIMQDRSITDSRKAQLLGRSATLDEIVRQAGLPATVRDNPDGTMRIETQIDGQPQSIDFRWVEPGQVPIDLDNPSLAQGVENVVMNPNNTTIRPEDRVTKEQFLALPRERRLEIIDRNRLTTPGHFDRSADPASGTVGTIVVEQNTPATFFHEYAHPFMDFMVKNGLISPEDAARYEAEFGKGGTLFNEETAADYFRNVVSPNVDFLHRSPVQKAADALGDYLTRRMARAKARVVSEHLRNQILEGKTSPIPVGLPTAKEFNARRRAELQAAIEKAVGSTVPAPAPQDQKKPEEIPPESNEWEHGEIAAVQLADLVLSSDPGYRPSLREGAQDLNGLEARAAIAASEESSRGKKGERKPILSVKNDEMPVVDMSGHVVWGNHQIAAAKRLMESGALWAENKQAEAEAARRGIAVPDGMANYVLVRRASKIQDDAGIAALAQQFRAGEVKYSVESNALREDRGVEKLMPRMEELSDKLKAMGYRVENSDTEGAYDTFGPDGNLVPWNQLPEQAQALARDIMRIDTLINRQADQRGIDIALRDAQRQFSVESIAPWDDKFQNALIHTTRSSITSKYEKDFNAAKAGDEDAAVRLIRATVKPDKIKELAGKYPDAIVIPVRAEEATGKNKIPHALAQAISDIGNLELNDDIVQVVRAAHTGANAVDRIMRRAAFDGTVIKGRNYILVDDHITQGGTISELRHYIINNGGKVVGVMALTASKGSTILRIKDLTLQRLNEKFGPEFDSLLRQGNIAGRSVALTESEGQYILKLSPVSFRNLVTTGRIEGGTQANEGQIPGSEVAKSYSVESLSDLLGSSGADLDRTLRDHGERLGLGAQVRGLDAAAPALLAIDRERPGLQLGLEAALAYRLMLEARIDRDFSAERWLWRNQLELPATVGKLTKALDGMQTEEGVRSLLADYAWKARAEALPNGASFDQVQAAKELALDAAILGASQADQRAYSVESSVPSEPWYFSQLRRVAEDKLPKKATVAQIRATLDPSNGSGVKAEEMKWTGLQDFLDSKKPGDVVTKAEVLEALRDVEVREIELSENDTKFSQYVLPGGENYREILLTLPKPDVISYPEWLKQTGKPNNDQSRAIWKSNKGSVIAPFTSPHFSELNILAHVRFNERTADGKRVLFIEEIQSDWAQKGREKGFDSDKEKSVSDLVEKLKADGWIAEQTWIDGMKTSSDPDNIGYHVFKYRTLFGPKAKTEEGAFRAMADKMLRDESRHITPHAPFVTKTDAWVRLAFKRMMRWAAENGFDQIAWTTGAQQAERYDLSKQIDNVAWVPSTSELKAFKNGVTEPVISESGVTEKNLEEYIGKEAARKLIEMPGKYDAFEDAEIKRLKNADLKVGGEGMKGYYDQILPSIAKEVAKAPVKDLTISGTMLTERDAIRQIMETAMTDLSSVSETGYDKALKYIAKKMDEGKSYVVARRMVSNLRNMDQNVVADIDREVRSRVARTANNETMTVHAVDLTPEMKAQALAGQRLFSVESLQIDPAKLDADYFLALERGDEKMAGQIVDEASGKTGLPVVAKDQNNRIIPPSLRFDLKSGDIRFSVEQAPRGYGNGSAVVADLAVQMLAGKTVDAKDVEKSIFDHAAIGLDPAQALDQANHYVQTEIGKAAREAMKSGGIREALDLIGQESEMDAIDAANVAGIGAERGVREGFKGGIALSERSRRDTDAAMKRRIQQATGMDDDAFDAHTGWNLAETLLGVQPAEFVGAPDQPATAPGKEKGPRESFDDLLGEEIPVPQGPREATPQEIADRNDRIRSMVEEARFMAANERKARAKRDAERAAQAEKPGESTEAEDAADLGETGRNAIPQNLLETHKIDLRRADEVAALLRISAESWIIAKSEGRLNRRNVWDDPAAVQDYRNTIVKQLERLAAAELDPTDWSPVQAERMISSIGTGLTPDQIESRSRQIVSFIQRNAIRQSRNELIGDIRSEISDRVKMPGELDELADDLKSKVTRSVRDAAMYVRKVIGLGPVGIEREFNRLDEIIEKQAANYAGTGRDVESDLAFRKAITQRMLLERWGGLKQKLPGEIVAAAEEIHGWLAGEQTRLRDRWFAEMEKQGAILSALIDAVTPADPGKPKVDDSSFLHKFGMSLMATLQQELIYLIRNGDPAKRQAGLDAIEQLMELESNGTTRYVVALDAYRKAWDDAIHQAVGSSSKWSLDARRYSRRLDERMPEDVTRALAESRVEALVANGMDEPAARAIAGEHATGKNRLTWGQGIQMYAHLAQEFYKDNAELHGRSGQVQILEQAFSAADLRFIDALRGIYETRRAELSAAVEEITGMPVLRPDALYMPVKMKTDKAEGMGTDKPVKTYQSLSASLTPRRRNGKDLDETAHVRDLYMSRAEDTARAVGYGRAGLTLAGVIGSPSFSKVVERYNGSAMLSRLRHHVVQTLAGVSRQSRAYDKMADGLRKWTTLISLSANPVPVAKQFASWPMYSAVLERGWADLGKALRSWNKADLEAVMASDEFKARYRLGGMTPETADALSKPDVSLVEMVYGIGMVPIKWGDFSPSAMVLPGLYRCRLNAIRGNYRTDAEAEKAAMSWAWRKLEQTQQSSRTANRPEMYRGGSSLEMLFLQYASAPLLQISHETSALFDVQAGVRGSKSRLASAIIINHMLIPFQFALIESATAYLTGDPDDKEKFKKRLIKDVVAGPFARIFLVGAIAEGISAILGGENRKIYQPQSIPAMNSFNQIAGSMGDIAHDAVERDYESIQSDLLDLLSTLSAPVRLTRKTIRNRSAE